MCQSCSFWLLRHARRGDFVLKRPVQLVIDWSSNFESWGPFLSSALLFMGCIFSPSHCIAFLEFFYFDNNRHAQMNWIMAHKHSTFHSCGMFSSHKWWIKKALPVFKEWKRNMLTLIAYCDLPMGAATLLVLSVISTICIWEEKRRRNTKHSRGGKTIY